MAIHIHIWMGSPLKELNNRTTWAFECACCYIQTNHTQTSPLTYCLDECLGEFYSKNVIKNGAYVSPKNVKLNMFLEVITFILVCWCRSLIIFIICGIYFHRYTKDVLIALEVRVSSGICHTTTVHCGYGFG